MMGHVYVQINPNKTEREKFLPVKANHQQVHH